MTNTLTQFEVDIYFKQKGEKELIATVVVDAESEAHAEKVAKQNTEYWTVGKPGENEAKMAGLKLSR